MAVVKKCQDLLSHVPTTTTLLDANERQFRERKPCQLASSKGCISKKAPHLDSTQVTQTEMLTPISYIEEKKDFSY